MTWQQTPLIVAFLLFGAPGTGHLAAQVFVAPEAVRGEVERGEIVVLDVGRSDSAFAAGHLPGAQRLAMRLPTPLRHSRQRRRFRPSGRAGRSS